jgi:signal peptidase
MQFNEETLQLLAHVIEKNGWIDLPAQGTSMYPFIRRGDICRFISCEAASLQKGDIILFRTSEGCLIAHRFLQTMEIQQQTRYLFKGDTNLGRDEAVSHEQIIGKLAWIVRNKAMIHVTDITVRFWSAWILLFPFTSRVLRMYLNRKESFKV